VKAVLDAEGPRLERAMRSGRQWPVERFRSQILEHALLRRLASSLVWGAFDARGALTRTFCPHDGTPELAGAAWITVVHPVQLDDKTRVRWGDYLGEHELTPPFAQIGRDVHEKGTMPAIANVTIPYRRLESLMTIGWTLAHQGLLVRAIDGGVVEIRYRFGQHMGDSILDRVALRKDGQTLDASALPAVEYSEVTRDVRALLAS
jgi:uncharacterized protein DUF4132